MDIEIRPTSSLDEYRSALSVIGHFFGWEPSAEAGERFARNLPFDRVLAAWEGETIVAGAGAFPLQTSVPGGASVPTAGVTVVGVLPTHRRRGLMTQLLRRQLEDARRDGEALAALWASEATIYGRFGFGLASWTGELEVPKERTAFALPFEPVGAVRVVGPDEALETFPQVYDAARAQIPGMMSRTRDWWELRMLNDAPDRPSQGGPTNRVLLEHDGLPVGYALYRMSQSFEDGSSTGKVIVREAVGATDAATREIWRFLFDIDWVARIEASLLPVDHPLLLLLAEPRRARFRLSDALWIRLVEVGAALSARTYSGDGALTLEVEDVLLPENSGCWRLEGGRAERTDAGPDLRLGIDTLGSAYLGGISFGQLGRAGRVEELVPGALGRADALFRADRAPWCPEIF